MKITIGFSPCPNDTFIFDALVNQKINTGGIQTEIVMEDVETLNKWALEGKLMVTKLSYPAFFNVLPTYELLSSGAALGKGVGPLLVAKESVAKEQLKDQLVAIPGKWTTANFLLGFAFPQLKNKKEMLFSDIEDAVLNDEAALGLLIHENRFTFEQKGLKKIADLGNTWEQEMKVPIPLGGIAVKRSLDQNIKQAVERLIKESIEYAFKHYPEIPSYIKDHSQEMEEDVMRKHIDLYVNDFSIDLGKVGRQAIETLFEEYKNQAAPGTNYPPLFLEKS